MHWEQQGWELGRVLQDEPPRPGSWLGHCSWCWHCAGAGLLSPRDATKAAKGQVLLLEASCKLVHGV